MGVKGLHILFAIPASSRKSAFFCAKAVFAIQSILNVQKAPARLDTNGASSGRRVRAGGSQKKKEVCVHRLETKVRERGGEENKA